MVVAFNKAGVFHLHHGQPEDDRDEAKQQKPHAKVAAEAAFVQLMFNS